MPRGTLSMQRRSTPAPQKPAPAPPPAHGHRGTGFPRAPGDGDGAGVLQLPPAHRCAALRPGLAASSCSGHSTPCCPGGSRALQPLHPTGRAACREGLGLCLEKGSLGARGSARLSPVPPLWQHKQNPRHQLSRLGTRSCQNLLFTSPICRRRIEPWARVCLGGSSQEMLRGGCAALSGPHRTHQNQTAEKKVRNDAGVWLPGGSVRVPRGSGLPPSPRRCRGCAGAIPGASRCWHVPGWLPITSSPPAGMHRAHPVMPAHPAAL